MADNRLIVDYPGTSPAASLRTAIAAGLLGPAPDRPAAACVLGYAESAALVPVTGGTFAGQDVDPTAILVRTTLFGDATLDGVVDFNDLVKLAQNYNTTDGAPPLVVDGDFTYDGVVDFNDLVKLAQNYNTAIPTAADSRRGPLHSRPRRRLRQRPRPALLAPLGTLILASRRRRRR